MARSSRVIPKEIAAFGERQFKETGAAIVEVLRVKTSFMRKHFKQLKGITFLVSVVSLDRIRVYFFNAAGTMLMGEDVESTVYNKIRRTSKLIAKYEKPKELTPEELRIEATQDLRDSLAKSIRRVARFLAIGEREFPDIFITRSAPTTSPHSFGLQIGEEGEFLFEESLMSMKYSAGIVSRSAFLSLLETYPKNVEICSIIGNGLALKLLKGGNRKTLLGAWRKKTKGLDSLPLVNHMISHVDSYSRDEFSRILSVLETAPDNVKMDDFLEVLRVLHDSALIPIGTEEYHTIQGFCKTLSKPRKLDARKHTLEAIHLAPRVICNPTPLDISLSTEHATSDENSWAKVTYFDQNKRPTFSIIEGTENPITAIEYWLNLEDVYPSSGGLISHGKDVVRRALGKLGLGGKSTGTFESRIEFSEKQLNSTEQAVLERLMTGQMDVLANTLVGSLQVVESLLKSGTIALLPGFNHIGITPDFLLVGPPDIVREVSRTSYLESTIFHSRSDSAAVVSAPGTWRNGLLENAGSSDVVVFTILSVESSRNILRDEQPFPSDDSVYSWSDGAI